MTRTKPLLRSLLCVALLVASSTKALAQNEAVEILSYRSSSGKVSLYDEQGNLLRRVEIAALPKPPVLVLEQSQERAIYRIATSEGDAWIQLRNVELSSGANVLSECEAARKITAVKQQQSANAVRMLDSCGK